VKVIIKARGSNLFIGAFAALASYALFHLVTVFPLSWITLPNQSVNEACRFWRAIMIAGVVVSGLIADRFGFRNTPGLLAILIVAVQLCRAVAVSAARPGWYIIFMLLVALLAFVCGQRWRWTQLEPRFRYTEC
jgi:hypothetical protein